MQKSDTIGELTKALAKVQAEIKPALKDSENPFFHSSYADLTSVWNACRELLAANGLAVIQGNSVGEIGTVIVETILSHSSGEWIQSELQLPLSKTDPQGVGSAVTYGRRYGLAAIVGIVADTDDDGNAASGNKTSPAGKAAPAGERKFDNSKPEFGKAATEAALATQAQIGLMARKADMNRINLDEFIQSEFADCEGTADLSKAAASYIIDQLQG